jgi:hypothetical protein
MVIAAAGALSVATAASAAAATWSQGTRGHADGPAEITHEASGAPRLTLTEDLAASQASEQSEDTWAQHAYLLRLAAVRHAIAQRKASSRAAAAGSPRQLAQGMLGSFGWSSGQFACLDPLWTHESGWSVTAENAGSGAYGIPQALPGTRMASAGADWRASAATQIKWGLDYIKGTYGSPCGAWTHEEATGWY